MEVAEAIVVVDTEAVDTEAVDTEAVDTEAVDTEEDEAAALEVQDRFDRHQSKSVTNSMLKLNQ
jgi:hypothetical protein